MKRVTFFGLLLMAATVVSFSSCTKDGDKDDDNTGSKTIKTGEIVVSSTELYKDDWVYFSFETGAEVEGIDSVNFNGLLTWDIAFHSRLGRTNGGGSGKGVAAIYDAGTSDFNSVITVDNSKFFSDTTVNLITGIGMFGPMYKAVPGNTVFDGAFEVDYSKHPPLYTCQNKVYVIKTVEGKYAKIQITGYFDEHGESGHINFKYAYQTDGSVNLK